MTLFFSVFGNEAGWGALVCLRDGGNRGAVGYSDHGGLPPSYIRFARE